MILRLFRWRGRGRKRPLSSASGDSVVCSVADATKKDAMAEAAHLNEWRPVLTAPIEQLCEAPSADTVRHAYDLYAAGVYAPFVLRDARMAARSARIQAGFAALVARAPELVEVALTEHPQVFSDMRRLKKWGQP
jgi:hypothetical protein